MKRIISTSLIILLLVAISCKTGIKQNQENKTKPEDEKVNEEYFFPEELTYYQNVTEVVPDKLYPIGWSKNGNFAYLIEPADEALGNYMAGVVVVSLVSDEVLWSWYTDPIVDEDLYREDVWQKHYDDIKKHLNKYGIIQQRSFDLMDTYFTYDKKDYIVRLETEKIKDPDMGINIISKSKLFIKSPQLGEKQIAEKNYETSMILGQQISGCLLSPYEDRVAIIVKSERWGYEGPPNVVEFEVFGANLSTGFKQSNE
jgi:hypothetical protein